VAAEHGGLIKKEKSSWVKLKVFPTNVWRPNEARNIFHFTVSSVRQPQKRSQSRT